ncbi:MAG TPA: ABC transporter ATP-binding protein [Pirellulaceae bacterium]|nr:ABC transporter ATP-binding protein [Pirellulaceae bacterium]
MLKVEDLVKSYRQPSGEVLEILDVPRYELAEGEQAVLLGASGGGKTTLLHLIAGIARPTSGRILIDGTDIARLSESGRDLMRAGKIGYVFQTFNLLSGFSALENVLLGMTFGRGRKDRQRAIDLLDKVGLSHRLHHRPTTMSVGEQQRVAVARALANRPRLLLADEPTANVDPRNQQQVIDLIRGFCRDENVALIVVTHADSVARQFERVDRLESINRVMQQVRGTA